jgi:CRISPR-associated endonuclease/helicase Cas3
MFMAYRAGREQFHCHRGAAGGGDSAVIEVPCLWTDEFGKPQVEPCHDGASFSAAHARFVTHRVSKLKTAPPLRVAELLPIPLQAGQREDRIHAAFAAKVREACLRLHHDHVETDPTSGKRVSFGIVRMANIEPILAVARTLIEGAMPEDVRLHLCVYHARFPLAQRSAVEAMLDATFNRRDLQAVWQLPEVRAALDAEGAEPDHLFVVLASPVCEVGRDWDADWALSEPSSMRALIQLAGRVQRHRRNVPKTPNVLVFNTNLNGIELGNGHGAAFTQPGFEASNDEQFQLRSHDLNQLLAEAEYRPLTAIPRIQPREQLEPRERWVDLEHQRIRSSMLPAPAAPMPASSRRRGGSRPQMEAPACWQHPQAALTGVLPQQQPFRNDTRPDVTLAWLPEDDDDAELKAHRVVDKPDGKRGEKLYVREALTTIALTPAAGVSRWGAFELATLVREQAEAQDMSPRRAAEKFTTVEVPPSGQGWFWDPWLGVGKHR